MTKRIQFIDAVRGLCVVLMVLHHLMYDLVAFLDAPVWLFSNPVLDIFHYFFAGLFILLSGVSSRFSRSNVKRGLKVIGAALLISAVTFFIKDPIYFGVLHFLGFSMVFYGLTEKFWKRFESYKFPICCVVLIVLSIFILRALNPVGVNYLWIVGLWDRNFFSADYFPIFPWIFVFLLGTWLGGVIREGRFPKWFYTVDMPLFPKIGRKAFIIYLLHQPVLYGVVMGIKVLFGL